MKLKNLMVVVLGALISQSAFAGITVDSCEVIPNMGLIGPARLVRQIGEHKWQAGIEMMFKANALSQWIETVYANPETNAPEWVFYVARTENSELATGNYFVERRTFKDGELDEATRVLCHITVTE